MSSKKVPTASIVREVPLFQYIYQYIFCRMGDGAPQGLCEDQRISEKLGDRKTRMRMGMGMEIGRRRVRLRTPQLASAREKKKEITYAAGGLGFKFTCSITNKSSSWLAWQYSSGDSPGTDKLPSRVC